MPTSSRKKAVFVLGTLDYRAVKKGEAIDDSTLHLLDRISDHAEVDAEIVFCVLDPWQAGKGKSKIGMKLLREERARVLSEIGSAAPDFVVCFGPTATACVFGKGNLSEGDLLRQGHKPLGDWGPPVFVTFGMENVRYKAGLAKWLALDVHAAAHGQTETEWGEYTILLPGQPGWGALPEELKGISSIGYDLETYPSVDPWHPNARIRMAVISNNVGQAWVVQADPASGLPQWLYDLIENPCIVKAGSNIKFDYLWHRRFGHTIRNMWDTSTHEHILDESNPKKDLKSLTFRYVPKLGDYSKGHRDLVRQRGGWEFVEDSEMYQYAGADGEASVGAYRAQRDLIHASEADIDEHPSALFRNLYAVLADMEHNGACIDMAANTKLDLLHELKLTALRAEIVAVLGPINPNSVQQLAEALKAKVPKVNLKIREWKAAMGDGEESTAKAILEREAHRHPIIAKVLEYRKYRTRHSTFIKGVREKHARKHHGLVFIHPTFNTAIVETYRLSSSRPNGQNFPRKDNDDPDLTVKRQFVSRFEGGSILEADQSQIEIRFAAWASQDAAMLRAIADGGDIHTSMAAIMLNKPAEEVTHEERHKCKARTFLILYGGGAKKLAADLKIPRRQAQKLINEYFETFSGLKIYIEREHAKVRAALEVKTVFGFRRRFIQPDHWDSPDGWSIQRQAFNTGIQNGAACLTYVAMINLHLWMGDQNLQSKMILQVHDSILVDVYPGEEKDVADLVRRAMETAAVAAVVQYGVSYIDVPLKCDIEIGSTWGDMAPFPQEAA